MDKLNDKPKIIKVMESSQKNEQLLNLNPVINNNNNISLNLRSYNLKGQSKSDKVSPFETNSKTLNKGDRSGINLMPQVANRIININSLDDIHQRRKQDNYY